MLKTLTCAAFAAAMLCAAQARADSWYEFQAKNAAAAGLTVAIDGASACTASAGAACTVKVPIQGDHTFAYAFEGGQSAAFTPGNLEIADVCTFDAKGAHCVDTTGHPTN